MMSARLRSTSACLIACLTGLTLAFPSQVAGADAGPGRPAHAQKPHQGSTKPHQAGRHQSSAALRSPLHRSFSGTKPATQHGRQHLAQQRALLRLITLRRLASGDPSLLSQNRKPLVLDGSQIRLIDGDTFAYGSERVRIRGIDTPEKSESGWFEATQRLDQLLHDGPIVIMPEAVDTYGRMVADVYVNGQNVAETLRNEGYAKPGSR